MSLAEKDIFEKKRRLSYTENLTLKLLFKIYKSKFSFSYENFNDSSNVLDRTSSFVSIQQKRSLFNNPTIAIARRRSMLYDGQIGDLHEVSEEDEEENILLPTSNSPRMQHPRKYSLQHSGQFQECFNFLIAMEKQPKPEII